MAVEEQERRRLQEALVDKLGPGPADTLMGYLPPVGWADVATKQDLQTMQAITHTELNVLGTELRTEMTNLGTELRTEIIGLRADMHQLLLSQTYRMMGFFIALSAVLVTALKIG